SPGVLLSSGYIAGGTVCGLIIAFFAFLPYGFTRVVDVSHVLGGAHAFQTDTEAIKKIETAVEEARQKGEAEEAKAESPEQKAERAEETQKAIDSIRSDFWLESLAAKILAM